MLATFLLTVIAMASFHSPDPPIKIEPAKEITLTILYDNYKYEDGFKNSWGFSCLIEGAHTVLVSDAVKITDNVWSTGEMGIEIIEQSMVIQTPKGLVVITGCAHPGIEDIVAKAVEIMDEPVLLVMGGFHLLRTGTDAVEDIAREFKDKHIQYAAPTHCSGDGTIRVFQEVFGEQYLKLGTGKVIQTAKL
jgi:metal-dependent hydrolase (beta-lactamase superfamily II)